MIAQVLILLVLLAVPPLTDGQRSQLVTVTDDSPTLEEPALHAILTNVLLWGGNDEAGAQIPDYDALLADPAAARGELFLIEGKFAGRPRRIELSDPGKPVDALTEWVLVVSDDPEEVAVVYFVDPEGKLETPAVSAQIRTAGWFYKVWADTDQDGHPTRYLTFVARSATVVGGQAPNQPSPILPMLLLVVVLAAAYILIRRMSKPRPQTRVLSHISDRNAMLSASEDNDPAKALQRMADQQDEH